MGLLYIIDFGTIEKTEKIMEPSVFKEDQMEKREYYPLSHSQKRIWYSELMYPYTGFANLAGSVIFSNEMVDFSCLKKAINLVIKRYDALRVRLIKTGEYDVMQYTAAYKEKDFDIFEGSSVKDLILQESKRPFSLIDSDLAYFALINPSENKCGYYFKYHHIICDAMSVTLLNKQIYTTYKTLVNGQCVLAEPEAPSFVEFLNRDKAYLDSCQYITDEAFWQNEFKDVSKPLDLHLRSKPKTIRAEREIHSMGSDMTASLNEFCKKNNTTIFRFFMSVFYIYFMRIASNNDIVISTGHHNRIDERERQMVGMTVSTLPIRICTDESTDFFTLLKHVTDRVADCLSHQCYPYDLLALNLRERGYDPKDLLCITLNHIPSLTEDYKVERYTPGFDPAWINIKINPNQQPKGAPLEIGIDYRIDLFDQSDIKRLFIRLETLISDIITNPGKKLYELDILPRYERQYVLNEFNNTFVDYSRNKCIHQLFSEQAVKTPDSTALVYKGKEYTYDELNKKTNQLARLLRSLGVIPDDCIGIMVERSEDIVIGAIAVFKAGGAYLPIDPGYPKNRINFMLKEGEVKVLLSQENLKGKAADFNGCWLDLGDDTLYSGDSCDIDNVNTPKDLAYVIYTSGSSGNPKGVMVEHGNLINFCIWYKDYYGLTESDNQAAYCSFVFDVSIADLYPPLIVGASVHIIPEEIRLSPYELNEYFNKHNITTVSLPTKVGEVFTQSTYNKSLRLLTVAGEKLVSSKHGQYMLMNAYGPTEATIYSTTFIVDKDYENIPIGKPLSNMCAYVVDKYGNLLPLGVPGELWLSGVQVSRGYLNRPELTDNKFIRNPFAAGEGNTRIYKTGDLVRWLPDGNLEFLGRIDTQVKIRGFRIEVQEIEQQLLRYPNISQAVVLDLNDSSGSSCLCAYLVTGKDDIDIKDLEKCLRLNLPDYMIPAHFVNMPSIPLTQNGKTDKEALWQSAKDLLVKKQRDIVLPRNQTEHKLSTMWKELLKLSEVSVTQSFFDIGGQSLLAIRLLVMIKEAFGLSLPVSILFKENTIEKLSRVIDGKSIKNMSRLVPVRTGRKSQPLFCIHDFTGEVLPYASLAACLGDDQTVYGLRYTYTRDDKHVSIETMAGDYIKEIRSIQPQGPYYLIGYSSGGTVAYEMAQQLLEQNEEVALLALLDTPNYSAYPSTIKYLYFIALRYFLGLVGILSFKNISMLSILDSKNSSMKMIGKALVRYMPKRYRGNLILFKAKRRALPIDEKLGWGHLIEGKMDTYEVSGDHMFILKKEISVKIANVIKKIVGNDVVL